MFRIPHMAFLFLFGRKPEDSGCGGKGSACSTPRSESEANWSIGDDEKRRSRTAREYYTFSKEKRYPLEELVPLAELEEGQEGKVVIAFGDRKLICRLCDLGLIPETQIRVLKRGLMEGPIILEVRSCEIAIGREIASKVLVKPL